MKKLTLTVLVAVGIFSGCTKYKKVTNGEDGTAASLHVVACCQDNVGGTLSYPSFLPSEHIQLCQTVKNACASNNCQYNNATYLAMSTDCGNQGYKIGDEYYKGKGY